MPGPYRVGVVGAGVAGTALSSLLSRDGHRVTLIERAPAVGPVGAGVVLQLSGQEVLRRVGVLEAVRPKTSPIHELYARHADGRQLIRTVYADLEPGCVGLGVHRGAVFAELFARAQTEPIDIRLGCEVVGREVTAGGVSLVDTAGRRHGPFDFVVGADGSRSGVRAACGFRPSVMPYSHGCLWAVAPGRSVEGRLLQVVRGNRHLCGLLPIGQGLMTLYWGLPVAEFAGLKARGLDSLKREIVAFCPEAAEVLDHVRDLGQLIPTTYRHVHLSRWHDDRAVVIGDAAHAISPHMAQGMNLALVDAWRLADSVRAAATPAAAFRLFRRRQREYIRYYATVMYLLSPFFQSDWRLLGWGRDVFLPLLPKVPWVRRQMLLTVAGVKGGFLTGRVEV